jgi:hypothetical protein
VLAAKVALLLILGAGYLITVVTIGDDLGRRYVLVTVHILRHSSLAETTSVERTSEYDGTNAELLQITVCLNRRSLVSDPLVRRCWRG